MRTEKRGIPVFYAFDIPSVSLSLSLSLSLCKYRAIQRFAEEKMHHIF
jgi:hypothetical protein